MVSYKSKSTPVQRIEDMIYLIRGQRVMLDFDLARVYGVKLKRLSEQVKRNSERFPQDFAFQLAFQEFVSMRSQFATASKRNIRYLPWAFTEHGALMLASVLNSQTAVEASVSVVRTFVLMREHIVANKELTRKLADLEQRVGAHDEAIARLFEAIRQLIEPPVPESRREIGFHARETAPPYGVGTGRPHRTCRQK
jgi:ORF6N domain